MANHLLTVDPDQQQRLEAVAARQVRSPEFLVRDAIEEYLDAHEKSEAVRLSSEELREVDEALEEFDRTGLHITLEEFGTWTDRLTRGEKAAMPKCHT